MNKVSQKCVRFDDTSKLGMGYRNASGRRHRINRTGHPRALFRRRLGAGTIILASIVACRGISCLGRTGVLHTWLDWIRLDGVMQVNSISTIFAAIDFNYVAVRGYFIYSDSRFPITMCLLGMSFNSYRLSNDQKGQRFSTGVVVRLGDLSFAYHLSRNSGLHFRFVHGLFTRQERSCPSGYETLHWGAALGRCRCVSPF